MNLDGINKLLVAGTFICVSVLMLSCGTASPKFTSHHKTTSGNKKVTNNTDDKAESSVLTESGADTGLATYYSDEFDGKPTYSGEIYDKNSISAAHISLPMFTVVKVTNTTNNKSVVVKVNDRMPKNDKGRVIDLSYSAAKEIDMLSQGIAPVKIEIIQTETSENKEEKIIKTNTRFK